MSLARIAEEIIRPYLASIGTDEIDTELENYIAAIRRTGACVPAVAAGIQGRDLASTDLPTAICDTLANEIRNDTLPQAEVSADGGPPETGNAYARLQPLNYDQLIGHESFKALMMDAIVASRKLGQPMQHILLTGPRGLGKTTLALATARERGDVSVHEYVGTQLSKPEEITTSALSWKPNDLIFIDEIHGMGKGAQEALFSMMEGGRLPIVQKRKGGGKFTSTIPAPKVTIVGATTNPAKLLTPFRNRFGFEYALQFYSDEEMATIGDRSCQILGYSIDEAGMAKLVSFCRNNPRTLNKKFIVQMYNTVIAHERTEMELADVDRLILLNGYNDKGFSADEWNYLIALSRLNGKGTSLASLSQMLDLEQSEVEDSVEPHLIRKGLVFKTSRGRKLTDDGKAIAAN